MNKLTLRRRTSTPKAREFNPQSNCHNLQTNDMHALTDRPQLNDNHGPCPLCWDVLNVLNIIKCKHKFFLIRALLNENSSLLYGQTGQLWARKWKIWRKSERPVVWPISIYIKTRSFPWVFFKGLSVVFQSLSIIINWWNSSKPSFVVGFFFYY